MARISELHYSNAYARNSGVAEFLEVALRPSDDPADFVVGFYEADGTLGIEITLNDPGVSVTTDPDNGELVYTISSTVFPILLTDPDGGGATNYEAYALTDVASNTLIDFYDIGGGTQNIVAQSGAAATAAAPGQAISTNIDPPSAANAAAYSIQFNQPNPNQPVFIPVTEGDSGLACFAAGTDINTVDGHCRVETLKAGDMVITRDNGPQPIRWVGQRRVRGLGAMAPVTLRAGRFGAQVDVTVSQQHRVFVTGWQAEILFGEPDILVPAKALINDTDVLCRPVSSMTYCHVLFDDHQIIESHGFWSESFLPLSYGLAGWQDDLRDEILTIFPELSLSNAPHVARPSVSVHLGRLLR